RIYRSRPAGSRGIYRHLSGDDIHPYRHFRGEAGEAGLMRAIFSMRSAGILFFAFFFIVPLLGVNQFYLYVATLVPIYVILAVGLNILVGYAGQLAFANAAMFGIGAYGAGLL